MKIRLASSIQKDSIVDGIGLRAVIWTQGCKHYCPGCHNVETWNPEGGVEYDTKDIAEEIISLENVDGVTFSGGDPLFQTKACLDISKRLKKENINIWCYTGYIYEDLEEMAKTNKDLEDFLNIIDVLVDGPFILEKKSYNVKFRGSSNQRLIDMIRTREKGRIVNLNIDQRVLEESNTKIYI